jgi:Fe-S-cluster-containing dehydrogenase component
MTRWSIVLDLDKCIGCHACTIACKTQNNTDMETDWAWVQPAGDPKAREGQDIPAGVYPNLSLFWVPVLCMHCGNPPCVAQCPTGSLQQRPDGIVVYDKQKCIGCRMCSWQCPYSIPRYSGTDGTIEKCTLCVTRIDAGQEPACVRACVYGARIFGDLDDPTSQAARLVAQKHARQALPEYGTDPGVRYVGPYQNNMFRHIPWKKETE